jgi:hypothetical protein
MSFKRDDVATGDGTPSNRIEYRTLDGHLAVVDLAHVDPRLLTSDTPACWFGYADGSRWFLFRDCDDDSGRWILFWLNGDDPQPPRRENQELDARGVIRWIESQNPRPPKVPLAFALAEIARIKERNEIGRVPGPEASVAGQRSKTANARGVAADDPLETTALMLGRASRKIELLRFLAAREGGRTHLTTVAQEFYNKRILSKPGIKNARRNVEFLRAALSDLGCPVQIVISGNEVRVLWPDSLA